MPRDHAPASVGKSIGSERVRDQRISYAVPLMAPQEVVEYLPLRRESEQMVVRRRADVASIVNQADDRLLVVVGPCSVHDVRAALEYAYRLSEKARDLEADLLIAMRVYFEKPRTTTGWKGLINDPHLDGSGDVKTGLMMARKLLLSVVGLGLAVGCEFLDPITPQYISDTVAWAAIGARTTESQIHRQLASGLSMPVAFKNGTDGDVGVAVDAIRSARTAHSFPGIDFTGAPAILHTQGNPDCHITLRGGREAPNYMPGPIEAALSLLREAGLPERVVIDASHDNSAKDHTRQPAVAAYVAEQVAAGNRAIVGLMLESFLVAGRQQLTLDEPLTYGQSITDACMDWETTSSVLDELAAAARERRARGAAGGQPATASTI